jgi:hypothetical protein
MQWVSGSAEQDVVALGRCDLLTSHDTRERRARRDKRFGLRVSKDYVFALTRSLCECVYCTKVLRLGLSGRLSTPGEELPRQFSDRKNHTLAIPTNEDGWSDQRGGQGMYIQQLAHGSVVRDVV